ncbi:hypothetical protein DYY67_1935 [Candidatus Nitrosotalea sp. TS]|nr:hypothetical protein [Candidatus Nitrosotalea sp. TS]
MEKNVIAKSLTPWFRFFSDQALWISSFLSTEFMENLPIKQITRYNAVDN